MAKKSRKPSKKSAAAPRAKPARPGWKTLAVLLVLASLSYVGLAAYKQSWADRHDLSMIGNGTPAVVQVHDVTCPLCKKLQANTEAALARFDGEIQYRIADLNTVEGRALAERYRVGKTTLLTFAGDGKFLNKYTGVLSVEALQSLFEKVAPPRT